MSTQETTRSDTHDEHRPLTTKEKTLLTRLLSDPFSYPMAFKTWHVRSLEISDLAIQMSNVIGLTRTLGLDPGSTGTISLLNTGSCVLYAGSDLPPGSLLCDGSVYATAVQPRLFDVIGYGFGGSGTTFNVPNIPPPAAGLKYVIVT